MDYPLCLRSSKPKFPKLLSKPITKNVISARKISTKPILFLPKYHFPTKSIIMNNNSHFCANYHLYPRASSEDHRGIDDVATNADYHLIPTAARGPGASIAAACILGVLCCGAALMIAPQKAAAGWPRLRSTVCETCGGSVGQSSSDDHSTFNFMAPRDAVISLSKVKRFFDQKEADRSDSAYKEFMQTKKIKALKDIKKGVKVETALVTMFKDNGMKGSDETIMGSFEFKIETLEILIAQGNFKKAFEILKSLGSEAFTFSDRRPLLYQAIIYSIRYDKDHSPDEYWEKFFTTSDSTPIMPPN